MLRLMELLAIVKPITPINRVVTLRDIEQEIFDAAER